MIVGTIGEVNKNATVLSVRFDTQNIEIVHLDGLETRPEIVKKRFFTK